MLYGYRRCSGRYRLHVSESMYRWQPFVELWLSARLHISAASDFGKSAFDHRANGHPTTPALDLGRRFKIVRNAIHASPIHGPPARLPQPDHAQAANIHHRHSRHSAPQEGQGAGLEHASGAVPGLPLHPSMRPSWMAAFVLSNSMQQLKVTPQNEKHPDYRRCRIYR